MSDKDRFGDKLRDKGKTDEDLYIQEQERKRRERAKAARNDSGEAAGTDAGKKDEKKDDTTASGSVRPRSTS